MSIRDASTLDAAIGDVVGRLDTVASFFASAIKWIVLLNLVVGWAALWLNVTELHLSMGDIDAVLVTVAFAIGPPAIVLVWLASGSVDLDLGRIDGAQVGG